VPQQPDDLIRIRRTFHQHAVWFQSLQRLPKAPRRARAMMTDAKDVKLRIGHQSHQKYNRLSFFSAFDSAATVPTP